MSLFFKLNTEHIILEMEKLQKTNELLEIEALKFCLKEYSSLYMNSPKHYRNENMGVDSWNLNINYKTCLLLCTTYKYICNKPNYSKVMTFYY